MLFRSYKFFTKNDFHQAVRYYQQAINQFYPDYNDTSITKNPLKFSGVFSYINLFNTLTAKADALEKLYKENNDKLIIIGFPANDFKQQEKGSDEEIAQFCKINYGVTFPLAKKSSVIEGPEQNPVFKWLTDKTKNGWTSKKQSWNFSKYLVNENGVLINYFDPSISPVSKEVLEAIKK